MQNRIVIMEKKDVKGFYFGIMRKRRKNYVWNGKGLRYFYGNKKKDR